MALFHRIERKRSGKNVHDIIRRQIADVMREVGEEAVERIKKAAPVDTGALRESIYMVFEGHSDYDTASAFASGLKPNAVIVPKHTTKSELTMVIGSAVLHAIFVEYGTVNAQAQPFMRPTIEWMRHEITARLKQRRQSGGLHR